MFVARCAWIVVCWMLIVVCRLSFVVVVVYHLMFAFACFWCVLCVDGGVMNVVLFVCCRLLCLVCGLFEYGWLVVLCCVVWYLLLVDCG